MVIFVAALEATLRFGEVSFAAGESDADLDFFFDVGVFGFGFALAGVWTGIALSEDSF